MQAGAPTAPGVPGQSHLLRSADGQSPGQEEPTLQSLLPRSAACPQLPSSATMEISDIQMVPLEQSPGTSLFLFLKIGSLLLFPGCSATKHLAQQDTCSAKHLQRHELADAIAKGSVRNQGCDTSSATKTQTPPLQVPKVSGCRPRGRADSSWSQKHSKPAPSASNHPHVLQ